MFTRAAMCVAFASASVMAAYADPISGLLSVGGSATYSTSSITFTGAGSVFGTSTGTFQGLPLCDACVTFPVNPFVYGSGFVSGLPIFNVVDNGVNVTLDVSSIDAGSGENSTGDLLLHGMGVLTETGYTPTMATFALSSQFGSTGASVSFSDSAMAVATTPEPSSLWLFGSGLLVGAYVVRRSARHLSLATVGK